MKIEASDAELKTLVQFVLAQGAGAKPAAKPAAVPTALFEANGCLGCHAFDKRVVGPAFNDVAAKYRGDKAAEANLFGKLKEGKDHPVKVEAPEGDLRAMVKAVLASAPKPAAARQAAPTAAAAAQLDNSVCLGCHGQQGFSTAGADGNPRALHVMPERFGNSVHGKLQLRRVPHQRHQDSARPGSPSGELRHLPRDQWRKRETRQRRGPDTPSSAWSST